MKRIFSVMTAILLLFSLTITALNVKADSSTSTKLLVLEIYDPSNSGVTAFENTLGTANYSFTRMTMKQFVASRDELDGEYDMIAITDGTYSTKDVLTYISEIKKANPKFSDMNARDYAHATTSILNDITKLRANEIINDYIKKGQPVIIGENALNNGGNLATLFSKANFNNNNYKNVFYYNSSKYASNSLSAVANNLKNYQITRPRFALTNNSPDTTKEYKPGDVLQFNLSMVRPTSIANKIYDARLYIDSDFNDQYDPSEIVVEKQLTSANDTISYTLPRGYSGIRNWKLEVIDMGTNLKDYQKGTISFTDQKVVVNVLQVQPTNSTQSSLTSSTNMNQSYLSNNKYQINIDTTDMYHFNMNASDSQYSNQNINGKYDMLVFGFQDEYYKYAPINTNAVTSVQNFINTGQSVLLTHDTLIGVNSNDPWLNLMDASGQQNPKTNLGLNAVNPSTKTQKINDSMITRYPFSLNSNIQVNLTHDQYYTLNLEDPNVIPWYNMVTDTTKDQYQRDIYDSWDHYYTYSKGNVTYSGTGHTNTKFPDDEQRLFVNTMYRAFLGSNHAPVITVNTPANNDTIPANQKIALSYTIQDFDLKDKTVSTKVYLNGNQVYSQDNVPNGSTIVQSIDHGMPNGGTAQLTIEATDVSGAKIQKVLNLNIVKLNANLQVNRTASTNDIVKVNSPVTINYSITPNDISSLAAQKLGTNPTLSGVNFSETFPANLDVTAPTGFAKTGSLDTGYTISGVLPPIKYSSNGNVYSAQPVTFSVMATPKTKNQFTLNNSVITYKDFDNSTKTLQFNPIVTQSDYPIDSIQLPDSIIINKGIPRNFSTDLKISPQNAGIKQIKWSESTGGSIFSIDPNTGVVTANSAGSGYVTATVTDVFGNVKQAFTYVTVRIPVQSIATKDLTMNVGDTASLPITVTPTEARSVITIVPDDPSLATIDKDKFTITALQPGKTNVTVSGIDANGNVISQTFQLTINPVLVSKINVDPSYKKINKFDQFTINATIEPSNATNKNLIWTSLNPSVADVSSNGTVTGKSTGRAQIQVASADGNATATVTVDVGSPLTGIVTNPSVINVQKGDNNKNVNSYIQYLPGDASNISSNKSFVASNSYIADVDSNGNIIANRLGTADILITVRDEDGHPFTATLTVNVVENDSNTNDTNTNNDKY